METPVKRRLLQDLKKLQNDPPFGISGTPIENNIMVWNALIFGPQDSPYEDGIFKLTMNFTKDYPNVAPTVKFITKVFHPNVHSDGSICIDILQDRWSPIYDVSAILTSIQSLLTDPNPESPIDCVAAMLYEENRQEYNKRVRECVEQNRDY